MVALCVLQPALPGPPAARAVAACEAQARLAPRKTAASPRGRPPFALGDSVMLGAAQALARAGVRVDARGCRQPSTGIDILARRATDARLPRVVIFGLGTNADLTRGDVRRALAIIGPRRNLVLVTPSNGGADPRLMRRAARRGERVCLADWARAVAADPALTGEDGIHLTSSGITAYVDMLKPYRRLKARRRNACG